jgi:NAD(P)-dependent dehydrogenase (short-subunit alcohol dehydrogenase family)
MKKNVLLTGASGGFGRLIVENLLKEGQDVVATMRDVSGKNKKLGEQFTNLGAKVFEIDVTSDF